MTIHRNFPGKPLCAAAILLTAAGLAGAGTYPEASGVQEFAFADGTTAFGDGSTLTSTVNGTTSPGAASVVNNALVLTPLNPSNVSTAFALPVLDAGRDVVSFTLSFSLAVGAADPSGTAHGEGFSVNFGSIPSGTGDGEAGFPMANGLTIGWDTRDSGGESPALRVYSNAVLAAEFTAEEMGGAWRISAPGAADPIPVAIAWESGTLNISIDGIAVATGVSTPGFVPGTGDRFAFSARTGSATQEVVIDNLHVTTTAATPDFTGGPVISEFLASNNDGLEDEDFDHSDWIEIYNGQDAAASLSGWYLTDDPANLRKWALPAIDLRALEYTYVFASGKDRTTGGAHPHASFRIGKGGGYLALVKPDGITIANQYTYPVQFDDISYGIKGAAMEAGYLESPTPGARNADRLGNGVVREAPVILNASGQPATSGFVTSETSFTIAPPLTPGAYVRYTVNGSLPVEPASGAASPRYEGPVPVTSRSVALRARVFAPGMLPGPVTTVAAVVLAGDLSAYRGTGAPFRSNLPVMVMDSFGYNVDGITDPNSSQRSIFRYTWTQIFDPAEGSVPGMASLGDTPHFSGPSGTHVRGQSSSGFPQKPYALELWDERNEDLDVSILGMPAESDWILYNPHNEETLMRNVLVYDTMRAWRRSGAGMRTRFVEVFFNQNAGNVSYADYRGIYVLMEKIKRTRDRVDIEKLNPEVTDPERITGGYMWKKDKPPNSVTITTTSSGGWGSQTWEVIEPTTVRNSPQLQWLRPYVQAFDSSLTRSNWRDPVDGYRQYADTASFADNLLWVEAYKQIDGYRISTYFHKSRDGKIAALPVWDYNLAAGNANYLGGENPFGWYYRKISGGNIPYWPRLLQDPEWVMEMWDRYWDARRTVLTTPGIHARIDAWADLLTAGDPRPVTNTSRPTTPPATDDLDTPVSRHFNKWRVLGVYNWPNANNFALRRTFQDEISNLKDWMMRRLDWMDLVSLEPAPSPLAKMRPPAIHDRTTGAEVYAGSAADGFRLDLVDPNAGEGTILYTLDGSDPRLFGGDRNPAALTWSGGATTRTVLVPEGGSWRYFTTRTSAPANDAADRPWTASAFDDSAWPPAPAPFGYGESGLATTFSGDRIPASTNGNQTSYFRTTFECANPDDVYELQADLIVDDGAVVYLNGAEAWRYNMPAPPLAITASTRAQGAIDGNGAGDVEAERVKVPVRLDPALLVAGTNSIAVEVHQFQYGSGNTGISAVRDMRFDLELSSTTAAPAAEPLAIDGSGTHELRARVLDGTRWSPVSIGRYGVAVAPAAAGNFVVTELHYNPAPPLPAELEAGATEANDFEFLEFLNIGSSPIDLSGVTIEAAIAFSFDAAPDSLRILQPGARILVVENLAAFNARYPGHGDRIAGTFAAGNLSNEGELLTVRAADGSVITGFAWQTIDPWPAIAGVRPHIEGKDYSILLNNPFTGPDAALGRNWRASASPGGSPGAADSSALPADPFADADGNGRPDIVDYAVPAGGDPAFVSSSRGTPVLELTVRLDADGYLAEPQFSTDLVNWSVAAVPVETRWNANGTATLRWQPDPASPADRLYGRIRFSLP